MRFELGQQVFFFAAIRHSASGSVDRVNCEANSFFGTVKSHPTRCALLLMDHTVKIIKSERGKDLALVNSCKYRFIYQRRDGAIKWRCTKNKCCASIVTDCDRTTVVTASGEHNHEMDSLVKIERQRLREICKEKRNDGLSFRPTKIVNAEFSKSEYKLGEKDLTAIKKALYLKRQKDWMRRHSVVKTNSASTVSPNYSSRVLQNQFE